MQLTLLKAATLGAAILLATSCKKPEAGGPPPPPEVNVASPVQDDEIVDYDYYTGRLAAVDRVELRPRISGLINEVLFKEGSLVKQGDLLVRIDPRPFQAELDKAKAETARVESNGNTAKDEYDRAEQAGPSLPAQEIASKKQAYAGAQASLVSAKAAEAAAALNVEFCEVKAPITGRISNKAVTPGNLVTGGTAAGTLLTTIVSIDPIYVYVDADEQSVLKYQRLSREGKRKTAREAQVDVQLALMDETEYTHKGHIDFVDNQFNIDTGTIRARAVFDNADAFLTPGYFGRLRVPGGGSYSGLLVSDRAIFSDQAVRYVFLVDKENKVSIHPIKPGTLHNGRRVVEGLTKDDRVIVTGGGTPFVRPGAVVKPVQIEMPNQAGPTADGDKKDPAKPAATQSSATSQP